MNIILFFIEIILVIIYINYTFETRKNVRIICKNYVDLVFRIEKMLSEYEMKVVDINKIKINKNFKKHKPNSKKMQDKEKYLIKNENFESKIIVDKNFVLKDGYTSYLLAKKYNIQKVVVVVN